MLERRSGPRKRSFLQGRIIYNNRTSSVDCVVRDFTGTGARLSFSGSITIPETFELHIPNKQETYRARMRWNRGSEIGVTIDSPEAAELPGAVPQNATLADRVARLERELNALKRQFLALHPSD